MRHLLTQRISARCIKGAQGVSGLPTPSRLQGFSPRQLQHGAECGLLFALQSSPQGRQRHVGLHQQAVEAAQRRSQRAVGEGKARRFQPVLITKHSVCDGRQRRGFLSPRAKPVFIALQPLRLPLRQLAPAAVNG